MASPPSKKSTTSPVAGAMKMFLRRKKSATDYQGQEEDPSSSMTKATVYQPSMNNSSFTSSSVSMMQTFVLVGGVGAETGSTIILDNISNGDDSSDGPDDDINFVGGFHPYSHPNTSYNNHINAKTTARTSSLTVTSPTSPSSSKFFGRFSRDRTSLSGSTSNGDLRATVSASSGFSRKDRSRQQSPAAESGSNRGRLLSLATEKQQPNRRSLSVDSMQLAHRIQQQHLQHHNPQNQQHENHHQQQQQPARTTSSRYPFPIEPVKSLLTRRAEPAGVSLAVPQALEALTDSLRKTSEEQQLQMLDVDADLDTSADFNNDIYWSLDAPLPPKPVIGSALAHQRYVPATTYVPQTSYNNPKKEKPLPNLSLRQWDDETGHPQKRVIQSPEIYSPTSFSNQQRPRSHTVGDIRRSSSPSQSSSKPTISRPPVPKIQQTLVSAPVQAPPPRSTNAFACLTPISAPVTMTEAGKASRSHLCQGSSSSLVLVAETSSPTQFYDAPKTRGVLHRYLAAMKGNSDSRTDEQQKDDEAALDRALLFEEMIEYGFPADVLEHQKKGLLKPQDYEDDYRDDEVDMSDPLDPTNCRYMTLRITLTPWHARAEESQLYGPLETASTSSSRFKTKVNKLFSRSSSSSGGASAGLPPSPSTTSLMSSQPLSRSSSKVLQAAQPSRSAPLTTEDEEEGEVMTAMVSPTTATAPSTASSSRSGSTDTVSGPRSPTPPLTAYRVKIQGHKEQASIRVLSSPPGNTITAPTLQSPSSLAFKEATHIQVQKNAQQQQPPRTGSLSALSQPMYASKNASVSSLSTPADPVALMASLSSSIPRKGSSPAAILYSSSAADAAEATAALASVFDDDDDDDDIVASMPRPPTKLMSLPINTAALAALQATVMATLPPQSAITMTTLPSQSSAIINTLPLRKVAAEGSIHPLSRGAVASDGKAVELQQEVLLDDDEQIEGVTSGSGIYKLGAQQQRSQSSLSSLESTRAAMLPPKNLRRPSSRSNLLDLNLTPTSSVPGSPSINPQRQGTKLFKEQQPHEKERRRSSTKTPPLLMAKSASRQRTGSVQSLASLSSISTINNTTCNKTNTITDGHADNETMTTTTLMNFNDLYEHQMQIEYEDITTEKGADEEEEQLKMLVSAQEDKVAESIISSSSVPEVGHPMPVSHFSCQTGQKSAHRDAEVLKEGCWRPIECNQTQTMQSFVFP
ncbi:hypothetical protein BGZ83_010982 [Gryganskiella cystojenkinii]|nr:hypothetical protein BGZ83_010982 [Gryganskiella cystojenkinii]